MTGRRTLISIGAVVSVLLVLAITVFVMRVRIEAEFTKTVSYAHGLAGQLRSYEERMGRYPETLEQMVEEGEMNPAYLDHWFDGTVVEYQKPPEHAGDSFVIVHIRYKGRRIEINKAFERSEFR